MKKDDLLSEAVNLLSKIVERWEEGQDDECHIPVSTIERARNLIDRIEEATLGKEEWPCVS